MYKRQALSTSEHRLSHAEGLNRMFPNRGTRLDERSQGDGLGLSIVMEIIEQYDGNITLCHSLLGGLSATIEIPKFNPLL